MPLPNEIIQASAGSGKTFALVIRFLKLLRLGVAPERIIALTFTKKAAGEFTDRIIRRLLDAARSGENAAALHADLEAAGGPPAAPPPDGFTPEALRAEFAGLLQAFLSALPKTFLGTLDSFFIRLLRCHPLEFGLDSDFAIAGADEFDRQTHFDLASGALFHSGVDPAAQQQFIDCFDFATFGQEGKSVVKMLQSFVTSLHDLWLAAPDPALWGNIHHITNSRWFEKHAGASKSEARERFLEALAGMKLKPGQLKILQTFVEAMEEWIPGTPAPKQLAAMLTEDRLRGKIGQLCAGKVTLKLWSLVTLDGMACAALEQLLGRVVSDEIKVASIRTAGLARMLGIFEEQWDTLVRSRGRLGFADVTHLLGGKSQGKPGPAFSSRPPLSGEARLWIDYRTDSSFDHWMLDEFQDTSRLQWRVIANLIDEAIQDPDGRGRSYFQVGDVKQAIYGWRGGDWILTTEISRDYSIAPRILADSYRSAPPIIDTVNQIFGDQGAIKEIFGDEAPDAVDWWSHWSWHRAARKELSGFAAVVRPGDGEGDDFENRLLPIEALLREIRPIDRGMSCAVLFRGNSEVRKATEWLRGREGMPLIISEVDMTPAMDNPLTVALLSLLKLAAHPGDSLARRHLEMTPLGSLVSADSGILNRTLREIARHGFTPWAAGWMETLRSLNLAPDSFTAGRMAHFLTLARQFDARGERDIDAFLRFCETTVAKETGSPRAVQVMTIHKSKGLEFDIVFMPLAKRIQAKDISLLAPLDRHGDIEWVLANVSKELAATVDELENARALALAKEYYEDFCIFYVAVTRAARGLYFVVEADADKSSAKTPRRWVNMTLANGPETELAAGGEVFKAVYAHGDERWFDAVPLQPAAAQTAAAPAPYVPAKDAGRTRLPRRTPSGSERRITTGEQLFSLRGAGARERGTLMHALLEQVDWLDTNSLQAMAQWFSRTHPTPEDWQREVLLDAERLLHNPAVQPVFTRPAALQDLWRERSFESILDGAWITGTFDRVVLQPGRAHVIDFKTDAVTAADVPDRAETYAPQVELYRQVLSRLLGLPESAIAATLVFTTPGILAQVPGCAAS